MLKIIFWAITLYFLYRFIVGFVIPIWRVSNRVKGQMRDFQSQVNQHQGNSYQHQSASQQASHEHDTPKKKEGDYIDFEEIRD